MIDQGSHRVKVVGCFTGESLEKKTPYFGVEFETVSDSPQSIYWTAYLTESKFTKKDGKETTLKDENLKTLLALGFQGRSLSDLSDENKQVSDLFLDIADPINVVIEHEEYTTDDGEVKTSAKVKYVNIGYGGPKRFDHKQAVVKFKSVDGDLLRLKNNSPKPEAAPKQEEVVNTDFVADDIPF